MDPTDKCRVHLTLSERGRRALRIAAINRGMSPGELVEHWALHRDTRPVSPGTTEARELEQFLVPSTSSTP